MISLRIEKDEWIETYSEAAHTAVFGTIKEKEKDRIDYALLAIDEEKPIGYITVIETDSDTAYWQFGGVFEWARGKNRALELFNIGLFEQSKHTKRVGFRVENTNFAMLKIALNAGFQIIGTRFYNGSVLVEFLKELGA